MSRFVAELALLISSCINKIKPSGLDIKFALWLRSSNSIIGKKKKVKCEEPEKSSNVCDAMQVGFGKSDLPTNQKVRSSSPHSQ